MRLASPLQNVMKLGHNKRAALPGPEDQKPSIKWVLRVF